MPRLLVARTIQMAVAFFVVAISAGCGRVEWNDDLEYPDRTAPLVQMEKHPDQGPLGFPPPGKAPVVPEWLIARGVSVLNPATLADQEWSGRWLASLKEEIFRLSQRLYDPSIEEINMEVQEFKKSYEQKRNAILQKFGF